jgi:hypothetical protein
MGTGTGSEWSGTGTKGSKIEGGIEKKQVTEGGNRNGQKIGGSGARSAR